MNVLEKTNGIFGEFMTLGNPPIEPTIYLFENSIEKWN